MRGGGDLYPPERSILRNDNYSGEEKEFVFISRKKCAESHVNGAALMAESTLDLHSASETIPGEDCGSGGCVCVCVCIYLNVINLFS